VIRKRFIPFVVKMNYGTSYALSFSESSLILINRNFYSE